MVTEDVAFALFFRPRPGGFDSSRVLTPGNLPSTAKKVLMPGDQPGGEGGWGAGRRRNWLMHLFLVFVFPFVCCLTAMAILQSHTWTFEVSTSCCCFVLFVLVFEKIASQKLTLPEPYLVHLATVLGRLRYEGFFLFLFLTTIDRCFKDGIVA